MTQYGSVHTSFDGANRFVVSWTQLQEYLQSDNEYPVIQLHETTINHRSYNNILSEQWYELFTEDLAYISESFKSIVYIYPTNTSVSWFLNNLFYKVRPFEDLQKLNLSGTVEEFFKQYGWTDVEIDMLRHTEVDRLKFILENELDITKFNQWGHSTIEEFKLWELRELCSLYFYDRSHAKLLSDQHIRELSDKFRNIKFVKLDDLRDCCTSILKSILDFFNLPSTQEELNIIYYQWIAKQDHICKDLIIDKIVTDTIAKKHLDYSSFNLTFFDEIFVQRKLLNNKIELACFNLDKFPSNTTDLSKLTIANV